jgi:hypothetical protein
MAWFVVPLLLDDDDVPLELDDELLDEEPLDDEELLDVDELLLDEPPELELDELEVGETIGGFGETIGGAGGTIAGAGGTITGSGETVGGAGTTGAVGAAGTGSVTVGLVPPPQPAVMTNINRLAAMAFMCLTLTVPP